MRIGQMLIDKKRIKLLIGFWDRFYKQLIEEKDCDLHSNLWQI